jgi:diacylglycerol kinase (ATP)
MRITLIHNPKAGHGKHTKRQLMDALANAGHHAIYRSTERNNYAKAFKKSTDLVIVAGGDGTIRDVASRLLDTGIPLSVLPLGTANNLARSLGFIASTDEIVARLQGGRKRVFDAGLARGPWGEQFFFEGAGGGLFADYVRVAKLAGRQNKQPSRKEEIRRHASSLRQMLRGYTARQWQLEVDGQDISGRYLLWEAMNIRSVGPALYLAPRAMTRDGRLDLVCAGERDRSVLTEYLDARFAGRKTNMSLPIRKFRELKISQNKSTVHLDDTFWPREKEQSKRRNEIEITVRPSALVILQPGRDLKLTMNSALR